MKTLPSAYLHIAILSLIPLASAPLAQAYYDPGIQRWINRDPVGDRSTSSRVATAQPVGARYQRTGNWTNAPYLFVENDPHSKLDYLGLWTVSVGGQGQFGFIVGGQIAVHFSFGYSKEQGWSFGGLFTPGLGAAGPASMSAGGFLQATSARSVADLKGLGAEVGASVTLGPGAGPSVGADMILGPTYAGGGFSVGASGGIPAEIHGLVTFTGGCDTHRKWK
jgi:hypothetical protein